MPTTYNIIKTQNDTLYNSIWNMHEMYSRDLNMQTYKMDYNNNLFFVSQIFFYLYIAAFLGLIIFLVFYSNFKWYIKLLIAAIFAGYPFVIYFLENQMVQR